MKLSIYAFLASLLFLHNASAYFIENGKVANSQKLRDSGTVAIIFSKDNVEQSVCTGVRIHRRVILTASHCVSNPYEFPKGIRQSLQPLDSSVSLEKVSSVVIPNLSTFYERSFSSDVTGFYDLALLILEKDSAAPVASIGSIDSIKQGDKIIQLGYGLQSSYDEQDNTQQSYPLSYLENAIDLKKDSQSAFRLKNPASSIREGDSGGPIFSVDPDGKYSVFGIVSNGDSRSLKVTIDGQTEYTDVSYFKKWIEQVINDKTFKVDITLDEVQFSENDLIFIHPDMHLEQHKNLCGNLSLKLGSSWELDKYGFCLPKDEEMCSKISTFEYGLHEVIWDKESNFCTR